MRVIHASLYLGWILWVDEGAGGVGAGVVPVGGRVHRLRRQRLCWSVAHLVDVNLARVNGLDVDQATHVVRKGRIQNVSRLHLEACGASRPGGNF